MKSIPYGRQHITQDDIDAVINSLKGDYLTQGPYISEFEKAFADYIGAKYAVAVSNGTAALHLSALALGVKNGDKIITTPITFVASANCIRYCGGEIVFADIDPETYLIDIDKVKVMLEKSPRGTYKGLIPVDFAGRVVDIKSLRSLADEHGLWILEDACHAPGGIYPGMDDERCGSGRWSELAIFSFHPVKHIACGEGGMITTNDASLYEKLLNLRTHGITREPNRFSNPREIAVGGITQGEQYPLWYMEMQELGYNYRLTDFQAALGISQLKRADDNLAIRKKIAGRYFDAFKNQPAIKGQSGVVKGHAYHLYVIEVEQRLELYNFLRQDGIFAQVHYIPTHLMPYYQKLGWKKGDFPNAEKYYSQCLSLPMYPTLSEAEQDFVIEKVLSLSR